MAVKAGQSQGTNTMTIQPAEVRYTTPVPGLSSVITVSSIGTLSMQSLLDDFISVGDPTNYVDVYQNPDLETALIDRGFSQLRPEILGIFEFNSPVTEDIVKTSAALTQETYSTNSAEMFDLQCQLKQLRYTEALEFLHQQLDISSKDVGAGIQLDETSEGGHFVVPYLSEMATAETILKWMTIAYNSISSVLEAMDVKLNSYIDPSDTDSEIVRSLEMFEGIVVGPGNLTLKEYMTSSSGLKIPEAAWWDPATPTQIVTQLLVDIVMRFIYPIDNYYSDAIEAVTDSGSGLSAGTVLGIDYISSTGREEILQTIEQLSALKYGSLSFSSSSETGGTSFSKGDFWKIYEDVAPRTTSQTSDVGFALGAWASDLMVVAALESDIIPELESIKDNSSRDDILKSLLGIDVMSFNIADVSPNLDSDKLIMAILPKDKDSSVDRKISTFQYSSTRLATGAYPLRTGKSYYLDEVVTSELTDVMDRLAELSSQLTTLQSKLVSLAKAFTSPDAPNSQPFISEDRLIANRMVYYLFEHTAGCLSYSLSKIGSGDYNEFIKVCVAAASSEDDDIAWYLYKYIMYKATAWWEDDLEGTNYSLAMSAATQIAVQLRTTWRGLYGDDSAGDWGDTDAGGREDVDIGYGPTSVGASDANNGLSGAFLGIEASELESMTEGEILAMFADDFMTAGGLFDIGYLAVNYFNADVMHAYFGGSTSKDIREFTGPNIGSSVYGAMTLCFYYMIKVYYSHLRFHQIAGEGEMLATTDCWVAREVIPEQWIDARTYVRHLSPSWFREGYMKYGERVAMFITDKPVLKSILRPMFKLFARAGRKYSERINAMGEI